MSFFITNILVGLGLSMDAFSLSILYGTLNLNKRKVLLLSFIVGIYHFFMPLIGYIIGDNILSQYILDPEFLIGIIFTIIAVQMFLSINKEEDIKPLSRAESLLLFGFTVSIDSFSIGMGFGTLKNNVMQILISSIIYSIMSFTFTYLGLTIGKKLSDKFGKIATLIGGIILFCFAIRYFLI